MFVGRFRVGIVFLNRLTSVRYDLSLYSEVGRYGSVNEIHKMANKIISDYEGKLPNRQKQGASIFYIPTKKDVREKAEHALLFGIATRGDPHLFISTQTLLEADMEDLKDLI